MTATTDFELKRTQEALERLAYGLAPRTAHRPSPQHLILASRRNLEAKFGTPVFHTVNQALQTLGRATQREVVYLDDPVSVAAWQAQPIGAPDRVGEWRDWVNQWSTDVSSVLLIGGPDLAPFAQLANPSDDDDTTLASDAAYAGPRPLSPTRAIGRLPDADDAAYLVRLIQATTDAHQASRQWATWWSVLGQKPPQPTAIGYTASIWRHAARAVFSVIGSPQRLRMSPPLDHAQAPTLEADGFCPAYFNLHGLRDTSGWYGQRDPLLAADYPAFPLALQPQGLLTAPQRRLLAFSAACYGAFIEGKQAMTSLALRLLDTQAAVFIGSTALAYGGLTEPLQATDELAAQFWRQLVVGKTVGEALRLAKLGLVDEMTRRQGYVDCEDQKAILTFVLYGDPMLRPFPNGRQGGRGAGEIGSGGVGEKGRKGAGETGSGGVGRKESGGDRETGSGGVGGEEGKGDGEFEGDRLVVAARRPRMVVDVPLATLRRVEQEVRRCLPDLGRVSIHPLAPLQSKSMDSRASAITLTVVETPQAGSLRQVVKVTLDADGSVTKLVVAHGARN